MIDVGGQALSVTELNEYARGLLASDPLLRNVTVSGEISGYKHHYSGHRYFTLKDASSRVQCVMFRQDAMSLDFTPADGMQVILRGNASLFVRDGSYQVYVSTMTRSGQGDLYVQFERLKRKLMAEGLFDPARKREIPMFPRKIGLVTSETGAAVRDMIRVARRRNPNVGILVAPCAVQGASAAKEIAAAIRRLNQNGECDVLLVGRGGGSIEDLWAFNEELVARAIVQSRIPVISCVGHEVDFTIADFAADLRAPTPSAAAELAVPILAELNDDLKKLKVRLSQALLSGQKVRQAELNRLTASPVLSSPHRMLLDGRFQALENSRRNLENAMLRRVDAAKHRLKLADAMLSTLNPDSVVERGYAIVTKNKRIVADVDRVKPKDCLELKMSNGRIRVIAEDIERSNGNGEEKADL